MSFDDMLKLARFNGSNMDFNLFKIRMLSSGALRDGFNKAYTQDLTVSTGTTATDAENLKLKNFAWNYLQMALEGPPLSIVLGIDSMNPFEAWNMLIQRYQPTGTEAYTKVNQQMELCDLEDPFGDPEVWITKLISLNTRLKDI
jgi:hypothetical protein